MLVHESLRLMQTYGILWFQTMAANVASRQKTGAANTLNDLLYLAFLFLGGSDCEI